jgi:hypothetical protein
LSLKLAYKPQAIKLFQLSVFGFLWDFSITNVLRKFKISAIIPKKQRGFSSCVIAWLLLAKFLACFQLAVNSCVFSVDSSGAIAFFLMQNFVACCCTRGIFNRLSAARFSQATLPCQN